MRLFVFYLSLGLVGVCGIELSHMGKNNGNSYLVCENVISYIEHTLCPNDLDLHFTPVTFTNFLN